jgi:hypothetical protein
MILDTKPGANNESEYGYFYTSDWSITNNSVRYQFGKNGKAAAARAGVSGD